MNTNESFILKRTPSDIWDDSNRINTHSDRFSPDISHCTVVQKAHKYNQRRTKPHRNTVRCMCLDHQDEWTSLLCLDSMRFYDSMRIVTFHNNSSLDSIDCSFRRGIKRNLRGSLTHWRFYWRLILSGHDSRKQLKLKAAPYKEWTASRSDCNVTYRLRAALTVWYKRLFYTQSRFLACCVWLRINFL